jgi:hypothetical protein
MGTYVLPAAAPPWEVSTLTFSPDVVQPATPALAVAPGWVAGWDAPGVVAGALDAGGVLGGAEAALVPVVLDELHAAASSAVPSNTMVPSAGRVTGVISGLLLVPR